MLKAHIHEPCLETCETELFFFKQGNKAELVSLTAPSLQKKRSWARRSSSSPAPRTGTRALTCSSGRPCWPRPSTPPRPIRSVRRPLQFKCVSTRQCSFYEETLYFYLTSEKFVLGKNEFWPLSLAGIPFLSRIQYISPHFFFFSAPYFFQRRFFTVSAS